MSLARAIYADADIYLLDDILSAVDVNVGKFIMEETILKYLRGKTVVMPTHAIKYLDRADNLILMEKGRIAAHGTEAEVQNIEAWKRLISIEKKKEKKR